MNRNDAVEMQTVAKCSTESPSLNTINSRKEMFKCLMQAYGSLIHRDVKPQLKQELQSDFSSAFCRLKEDVDLVFDRAANSHIHKHIAANQDLCRVFIGDFQHIDAAEISVAELICLRNGKNVCCSKLTTV